MSRLCLLFLLVLIVELLLATYYSYELNIYAVRILVVTAIYWPVYFFILVVIAIPFMTSHNFTPNPVRLFVDGLISTAVTVFGFGYAYRYFGIIGEPGEPIRSIDYVYFSMVTFSTLGYGDFKPSEDARIIAALQAILGNLHLGIIVAAAFFAAYVNSGQKDTEGNDSNKKTDGQDD